MKKGLWAIIDAKVKLSTFNSTISVQVLGFKWIGTDLPMVLEEAISWPENPQDSSCWGALTMNIC